MKFYDTLLELSHCSTFEAMEALSRNAIGDPNELNPIERLLNENSHFIDTSCLEALHNLGKKIVKILDEGREKPPDLLFETVIKIDKLCLSLTDSKLGMASVKASA